MEKIIKCFVSVLLLATYSNVIAQVPQAGIDAEVRQQWDQAIIIYLDTLKKHPEDQQTAFRLADIYASQNRLDEQITLLNKLVQNGVRNAAVYYRLSQVYSLAGRKEQALTAINQTIEFEPDKLEYRVAHAQLASWNGDNELALSSYLKVKNIDPDYERIDFLVAQLYAWQGKLKKAASMMQQYLKQVKDDEVAWLELIKIQTWQGAYAKAQTTLEKYRQQFGESGNYWKRKARLHARADQPQAAFASLAQLDSQASTHYENLFTYTLNSFYYKDHQNGHQWLQKTILERPEEQETQDLIRFMTYPLKSHILVSYDVYQGSDTVEIDKLHIAGRLRFTDDLHLVLGRDDYDVSADGQTGLEAVNGDLSVDLEQDFVGLTYQWTPELFITGELREADGGGFNSEDGYQLALNYRPSDNWHWYLSSTNQPYIISPRTVTLPIEEDKSSVRAIYRPNLKNTIDTTVNYRDLSDGNEQQEIIAAYRYALTRTGQWVVDVGLSGWWFSFDNSNFNGYYSPENYQRFAGTFLSYWKWDDDNGMAFNLGMGYQKDNSMSNYEFGYDASIMGFFGIYKYWYLEVGVGYTERRQPDTAFDALMGTITLRYRF